jgi:hypothetical protein
MIISATGGGKEYEPCPEYNGKAVCVDVSPLMEYDTEYGKKMKFKFVFEVDILDTARDPVRPWVVLTKPMVASLHEKAALTKFLKDWFGRHLSDTENKGLDPDSLIGRSAMLVVAHEPSHDGTRTYANIKLIMPLKNGDMKPSGLWQRIKDRPPKVEGGAPSAPSAPQQQVLDLDKVQVHVGKFRGSPIGALNDAAVKGLAEHWLPKAMANQSATREDNQLIEAVNARLMLIQAANRPGAEDDVPF